MIFFRLRNNPQIPTKKRVKDTPKILNKLIGIFSLFYANWVPKAPGRYVLRMYQSGSFLRPTDGLPLVLPCGGLLISWKASFGAPLWGTASFPWSSAVKSKILTKGRHACGGLVNLPSFG
jgi:hypothetical protein